MLVSRIRRLGADLLRTGILLIAIGMGTLLQPPQVAAQETDYEEWLRQQQQEYEQFLTEQDKAFLTYLKQEWTSASVDTTTATPIDDKPRQIPRVEQPPSNKPSPPTADSAVDPALNPRPQQPPPESDSFPRSGEERTPDNMEEAMDQLDAATGDQPPSETPPSPEPEQTPPDEQPPEEPPVDPSSEEPSSDQQSSETSLPETPSSEESPPAPPTPEEETETASLNRKASLSFFGAATTVPYGIASTPRLEGRPGKSSIRSFWKNMAESPYRPTLDVLQKQREYLELGDWGYYLYLKDLGSQLYGDGASSERVLWTWFMLMKSGYAARVGYRENEVFLMLPVDQKIFGRPQMHINGQRYYLMVEEINGSLRTYKEQHSTADQVLNLNKGSLPKLKASAKQRTVAFTFQDRRHELKVAYNPATVEYLRAYPSVDLTVLFDAGVSAEARSAFENSLRPLVTDRPQREALNLLLKFTQFATDYKRDQDHFGEERYLFPEESLASDYSDCEDRAILLAYLTRTLLDRDVVGLQWPNHVALAVQAGNGLQTISEDHTVTVDGNTYIYADPTYIGSHLGMEMPLIEGQEPEIITLGR